VKIQVGSEKLLVLDSGGVDADDGELCGERLEVRVRVKGALQLQ